MKIVIKTACLVFLILQILQKLINTVGSFYKMLCGKIVDVGYIYSIITFQNIDCLIFFRV